MIRRSSLVVLVLLVLCGTASCGASQRESTIKAALVTTDTARDSFIAYDRGHLKTIVKTATSLAQGNAAITAYEASTARTRVVTAFEGTYRAIALAATLQDDASLNGLQAAIGQLLAAVTAVMGAPK